MPSEVERQDEYRETAVDIPSSLTKVQNDAKGENLLNSQLTTQVGRMEESEDEEHIDPS